MFRPSIKTWLGAVVALLSLSFAMSPTAFGDVIHHVSNSQGLYLRTGPATSYSAITLMPNNARPRTQPPSGGTYLSSTQTLRLCANSTNDGVCMPAGMPTVSANSSVTMVCWEKDAKSQMWFWINAANGSGYVYSSYVQRQTTTPYCPNNLEFAAAEAAIARVNGSAYASTADQALFAPSEWSPGPVGEWSGDCPKLPYVAWHAAGVTIPKQNAITNYNTWVSQRGALPKSTPPRGAVVFYNITQWGHTAIALGDGFLATTQGLDKGYLPNAIKSYNYFLNYLGWVEPK